MTKGTKNNILVGVMVTLISSAIIGMFVIALDYYIYKGKQELINTQHIEQKGVINKMYRNSVERMNIFEDKITKFESDNKIQHDELHVSIKQLVWAVSKNNKDMKKTLDEIKSYNTYGNLIVCKPDTNETNWKRY